VSIEVDPPAAFVDVDVSGDVVEVEVVGQGEKGDPGGGGDFQTVGPFDLLEGGGTLTGVPRHVAVSGSEGDLPGPVSVTMPSAPADPDGAWTVSYGAFDDASLDELDVVGALNLSVIPRGYTAVLTPVPGVGWFCDGLFPTATVPTGGGAVDSVNGETGVVVLDAGDVGADPAGTAAGLVDDLSGVSNQATARTNLGLGTAAVTDTGTGSSNVILGNDARLTDSRTPTSHNHAASEITSGTIDQARLGTGSAGAGAKFLADDQTYKTVSSGIADPGGANDDFLQRKSGAWTNRTVAQVKTDLSVPAAPFVLETPVGQYVGPSAPNTVISNQTDLYLSAGGRGTACLIYLAAGTYDRIGVSLQSAGAAIIRIGLYAAGSGGLPGARVLDAGTIDVSGSTGLREITISQTVTAGWYWASVSADSYTSTFSLYGLNGSLAPFIAGGVHYSTSSIRQKPGVASSGFGTSGIPDPFPTVSWSPDGAPKVILRRSA